MSISNLNNSHLSDEQMTAVNKALTDLEKALEPVNINLTAEDRNRYGRVNEQNKLFINKTRDYAQTQPTLRVADVNWEEFERDFKSRTFLESIISRLKNLEDRCTNSKILYDFDNYQDALQDYAYTQYRANSQAVGYEQKYAEQKQFFVRPRKGKVQDNENDLPKD